MTSQRLGAVGDPVGPGEEFGFGSRDGEKLSAERWEGVSSVGLNLWPCSIPGCWGGPPLHVKRDIKKEVTAYTLFPVELPCKSPGSLVPGVNAAVVRMGRLRSRRVKRLAEG